MATVTKVDEDDQDSSVEVGERWEIYSGIVGLSLYQYGLGKTSWGDSECYSRDEFEEYVQHYGLIFDDGDAIASAAEELWPTLG